MKLTNLRQFAVAATLILAASTSTQAQVVTNFFQAVTNLSPAAYWPLQETGQPPLADVETNLGSFGNIANAIYSSTNAVKAQPGVAGGYLSVAFVGGSSSGSFLGVPNASPKISLPVGPFSVEAWIYPSNLNNNLTIMAQAGLTATPGLNGTQSGAGWSLNQNYDPYTGVATPGWSFHVYNGVNIFGGADALVATNYSTNTWYHLVGVFDGTNATLYVDGVNATTASVQMSAGTSYVPDTWDFLQIGAGRGLNENDYYGEIEEAAIYTNALTQAQISQDFNAVSGSSSSYQTTILGNKPVMYWRMDSPANNIAQSIGAYPVAVNYGLIANLNGLYSSASTPGVSGPMYAGMTNGFNVSGLACAFDGMGDDSTNVTATFTNGVPFASQYVNAGVLITNLPGALNPITNSFSLMYWFKCNPMDDRRNAVFGHSDSNWRCSLLANQVTANSGKGSDQGVSFNINDGNWHFVTFVFTNTFVHGASPPAGWLATNYMYIDGVLEASALCSNLTSAGSFTNVMIGGAPDKNAYGNAGYNGGANGSQMFLGSLAHVAFFTNALSGTQIQSLYSMAGSPPLIQSQPSPVSFTNNAGATNVFGTFKVSGASTLGYNWFYNSAPSYSGAIQLSDGGSGAGSNATGSATAQLTITNVGPGDTGYYFVVATNSYGSVTSVLSHETVVLAPVIAAQNPTGPFSAYVGQNNLGISVTALGSGLSYQWYTNGVADTTAGTASTYPWTVQAGQTGETFQCVVANGNGSASSAVATLTTILTVPAGAGNGAFQANLLGLNPVTYWPLQESVQPPSAQIETNYGSLGAVANAYYASTNAVPQANGITPDGDGSVNFAGGVAGSFLYVPIANSVSLPAGAFTVEAWVYPTNTSPHANVIICQTGAPGSGGLNGGANSAGWALAQNLVPSTGSTNYEGWSFHVFNGVGSQGGAEATVPQLITPNTWYHIVGVFDGANCFLYIDGTNATPQGDQIPITGSYVRDTWDQLAIGSASGGALNADRYFGNIDEVAIYTNALTFLQISNHYALINNSYSSVVLGDKPYMYWRMDAPAYTSPDITAYPLAINYGSAPNMNGLCFEGNIPGVAGPTNSGLGSSSLACSFNGIGTSDTNDIAIFCPDDYYNLTFAFKSNSIDSGILCTNDDPSLCATNIPFTLACWFKGNPADSTRFQGLVGIHGDDGPRIAMQNGQLQFFAGTGGNLVSGTTENYNDGNWHFVACVYSNAGTIATGGNLMYIDGVLVASAAITTGENPVLATNRDTVMLGGSPDYVDSGNGNGYEPRFFSGSLAHIAYFTNILTGPQILNLYTNATAGLNPLGAGVPPIITGQPFPFPSELRQVAGGTGQYIFEGVTAQGYGTLAYQWYFNNTSSNYAGASGLVNDNVNIFNAQTGNMTVSNLNATQTGFYFCVVSNIYGSVTSVIDNVQVFVPPSIIAQNPSGAFSLYPGQTTPLSVTVLGESNNLAFQWYTNNGGGFVADTTGTAASYSVTAGQPAVSGETYQCIVTNFAGSATSLVDTLTILPFPSALTNAAFSSNVLALKPTDYWPMHEIASPAQGDIETNYGSLGALGNGYYADWDFNNYNPGNTLVTHGFGSALVGDNNSAVSFVGQTNACLVVPHISPLTTIKAPFTLEAWVKPYFAQPKTFGAFIAQGGGAGLNGGSTEGGFTFLWNGSPNTFSLTMFNGSGSGSTEPKTVNNYQADQWYHMVATFDGANVTIYINGQPASLQNSATATMNPDNWSPLLIGAGRWNASGPQDPFEGAVDEVAIYTNLLSPSRIQQHYNAGSMGPSTYGAYFTNVLADNPLLYYRMDSPTYTRPAQSSWPVAVNYGTVAINGVYEPGVVPGTASGPSPAGFTGTNAMPGNGMGGYVDAGSATALSANPGPTNTAFSYMAWFRGHPGQPQSFQGVMSGNDATWRCSINSSGRLQVHGQGSDITTALTYNDGNWHQIVLTCVESNIVTKAGNTNFLYVDGLLVGSFAGAGANTPTSQPGPEVYIGNEVGFTNNPVGPERCFSADICEAAFFTGTTLTPAQVLSLYNSAGQPPYINIQPVSATIDGNLAFTNTVVAGGYAPLSYQWYENGVALANAGNLSGAVASGVLTNSLIINPVEAGNQGSYYVVVTNNYGSVTSQVATLTVHTNPVISAEFPVPYTNLYTVFSNANPAFTVAVVGAVPLTYEWFTNGIIDGAALTTSNLTLTSVQMSFTNYCVITNTFGVTTSAVWSAQVIPDPTNSNGGPAAYPQSVLALNPIGYWRMDDTNENGVDAGQGDFGDVCHDYVSGDDGIYTNCQMGFAGYNPVSDPSDSSAEFGESADLGSDFGDSLAFGIQNINFGTPTGSNTAFTIEAWVQGFVQSYDAGIVSLGISGSEQFDLDTGSDPGHKFRFFFRDATGATHSVASSVSPAVLSEGPWFHLAAVVDEVNSNSVTLYINGQNAGSTALTSGLGVLSSSSLMAIGSRKGSATTNYNFQFLGNINDVSAYNYALTPSQVLNQYLVSGVPPILAQSPVTSTNASGNGFLAIPTVAYGTGPLTAWWYDVSGGTNIVTLTTNGTIFNSGLIVSNVPGGWNNDQLELTVSNSYGGTNVFVVLSIFTNAPAFTVGLAPQVNLTLNQSYTYTPTVLGAVPITYQWYSNSLPVIGATNITYSPSSANAGVTVYSLVANNTYGSATNLSAFTVFAAPTNIYGAYVLGLKPVGYWPLQETNPAALATVETNYGSLGALGNAYYAVTTANETNVLFNQSGALTGSGNNDTSVQFASPDGTNYAFVPRLSPKLTLVPPFTMETWVNSGSTAFSDLISESGNGLNGVPGGGTWGGPRLSYAGNNGGGPALQLYIANGSGTTRNDVSTPANSLPLNSGWHHCVATYDGTTTMLYIDGQLELSSTALGGGNTMAIDTSSPLTIGSGLWGGTSTGPSRGYSGGMDEVAIYTNILTPLQVTNHYLSAITSGSNYSQTVINDGPILYYRMDCPGYTNAAASFCPAAVNFGTAPTNGTYVSGTRPGYVAGPPIVTLGTNVASPINGITACIDAGYDSSFNPTNQLTALGWFKGNPGDSRRQVLMSHGANWALVMIGTNGTVAFTNKAGSVTSSTVVNDGNWHFVAGVYDGVNNYIYVDGGLDRQAVASGLPGSDTTHDLFLGGDALYTAVGVNQTYFAGAIAQAAFFTNALTASQIQNMYYLATVPAGLRVGLGPTSVTVYNGQPFTFTAQTSGTQPFYYQWYNGASPILGATNASYTAIAGASASYNCVVTNGYNGYSSTNAGPVTLNSIPGPTSLYQATVMSNSPAAYWRLTEQPDNGSGNNGTIAYDYAGGHNGVYTNVQLGIPGFSTTDSADLAALFGPSNNVGALSNSYVSEIYNDGITPISFAQPVGSNGELSIEAWINSTNSSQISGAGIVAKGYGGGGEQFDLDVYGGNLRFFVRDASGGVHGPTSTFTPIVGQWYHVVAVYDGANGAAHIYVNGADVADTTGIASGIGLLNTSTANTSLPQDAYVSIGARTSGETQNYYDLQFQGVIDDVALYNYALTPAQVAADYHAGTVSTVSFTNPPPISVSTVNNQLSLTWPSKYVGYYFLQVQTNSIHIGISNNWVPYGGSIAATLNAGGVTNLINPANGCVFYRLMTNAP